MEESYKLFLLSVLMSLTFLSNSCGILALYKRKIAGGKLTRMYYFLLHLFITDIIVTFSTLLPELIITAVSGSKFPWNDTICKCMKFVKMFGPYLSSYILVMIAMDRFQAICYPLNNHFWQPSRSKQKIVTAWILSIVFCIPHGLLFKKTENHDANTCSALIGSQRESSKSSTGDWGLRIHVSWFALSNFIVPLFALSFYYVKICTKIRQNLRAKKRMLPSKSIKNQSFESLDFTMRPRASSLEGISRAKIRSVKQTVVVIVSYIICSAPTVLVQLWKAWIDGSIQELDDSWYNWLVTLNSLSNPWIYICLNRDLYASVFCCLTIQGFEKDLKKPPVMISNVQSRYRARSFTTSQIQSTIARPQLRFSSPNCSRRKSTPATNEQMSCHSQNIQLKVSLRRNT